MKLFLAAWIVSALAVLADAGVSMNNPFYCYMTDPVRSTTMMHSTYTSYEAIRRFNFTTVDPTISTCTSSKFWYLGKFGSRFPHLGNYQSMLSFAESSIQADIARNYDAGRTTLCRQDFEAIRDWTIGPDFNLQNVSLVTVAGAMAIRNIAGRFQQHFPDVLTEDYHPDRFHFRHTDNERTNASARAFAVGLFGENGAHDVIYEDVPAVDWLLNPYGNCPLFNEEVNPNYLPEREAFLVGPEVEEMLNDLNARLGFRGSNQLSLQTVFVMWDWCTFETSSTFELSNSPTGPNSVWCAPFTVANQMILEYLEDLRHFYASAYGVRNQRLLVNMHCGLLQDLLTLMQSDNATGPEARIFISSTQALQGLFVALDLFRDTWPPHQHNYAQQSSRNWLTSVMQAFGSNLAIVRYDCDDGDHDLIFLVNERPVIVPGCDTQTGKCKLSVIVNKLQRFIGVNCETFFCSNN